jgi:hypothetical protein
MKSTSTLDVALAYLANHPKRFIFPIRNGRNEESRQAYEAMNLC